MFAFAGVGSRSLFSMANPAAETPYNGAILIIKKDAYKNILFGENISEVFGSAFVSFNFSEMFARTERESCRHYVYHDFI